MSGQPLKSFRLIEELAVSEYFTAYRAVHTPTSQDVKLTRFTSELSGSANFRAAFRKDEPSLSALDHASLLPILYWGDDAGRLFYASELPTGGSLATHLQAGHTFLWDEFTDIGWQIASAVQQAHNVGVTHGRLTADSVIISEKLRAKVTGFGLYHWIAAIAEGLSSSSLSDLVRQDLIALGRLLDSLLSCVAYTAEAPASSGQLTDVQDLIETLKRPHLDFTARDVQGRLGNMLLNVSGESIDMIDHREGQGRSRRSIVDELFEEPEPRMTPASVPASSKSSLPGFWVAIVVITIVTVSVAVFVWKL